MTTTSRSVRRLLIRDGKIERVGGRPPRTGEMTNFSGMPSATKGVWPRHKSRRGRRSNG